MTDSRQEFDRQLDAIEAKVIELFAMVAEDLPKATHALLSGDSQVLAVVTEREQVIDALYPEIERLVNREILLQAPVASDLRFLLSVLRIVPEIERSHDLVVHVAPILLGSGSRLFEGVGPDLKLEQLRAVEAPGVAHLSYRVVK